MEAEECICLEHYIVLKVQWISRLRCISVLCILNRVILDAKYVLYQSQILPSMVEHSLYVVIPIKQDEETPL